MLRRLAHSLAVHRAVIAFVILTMSNAYAIYAVNENASARSRDNRASEAFKQREIDTNKQTISEIVRVGNEAIIRSCAGRNELRTSIIGLVDSTVERSRVMAVATVASPTASDAQKMAAQRNLATIAAFSKETREKLTTEKCGGPFAEPQSG